MLACYLLDARITLSFASERAVETYYSRTIQGSSNTQSSLLIVSSPTNHSQAVFQFVQVRPRNSVSSQVIRVVK